MACWMCAWQAIHAWQTGPTADQSRSFETDKPKTYWQKGVALRCTSASAKEAAHLLGRATRGPREGDAVHTAADGVLPCLADACRHLPTPHRPCLIRQQQRTHACSADSVPLTDRGTVMRSPAASIQALCCASTVTPRPPTPGRGAPAHQRPPAAERPPAAGPP